MSPSHREALAQLGYGIKARRGFTMLTGEVGTGKTTLIHALLEELNGSTHTAFVYHTIVSPRDLLRYVCEDFGVVGTASKRGEALELHDYLVLLNQFLLESYRRGENVALIIDEAQNLSIEVLESIRLLSNFETSQDKLLQILLVGQPELRDKLDLPELRQLRQRIGLRCSIRPLTAEETSDYIRARLRIAGAMDLGVFSDRAGERIAQYTGGIPRLVNLVCDHCLLIGYADQRRRIGPDMVDEAIQYLEEGRPPRRVRRGPARKEAAALRWDVSLIAAVILVALTVIAFHPEVMDNVSSLLQSTLYEIADFARDIQGLLVR